MGGDGGSAFLDVELRACERVLLVAPEKAQRHALVESLVGWRSALGDLDFLGITSAGVRNHPLDIPHERMGIASDRIPLIDSLTIEENVSLPLEIVGGADRVRVSEVLAKLELTKLRRRTPDRCSPAEAFRARLARAVIHRPPLVIVDLTDGAEVAGIDNEPFYALLNELIPRSAVLILDDGPRDTAWVSRRIELETEATDELAEAA